MYTCCPHCQTCFRITKAQLDVAQGKVRCGHCKQVFNGKQHLHDELPGQKTKPAAPVVTPPTVAPATSHPEPAEPEETFGKASDIDFDLFDFSTIPASSEEDEDWDADIKEVLDEPDDLESDTWFEEDEFDEEEEDVTANLDEPYDGLDEAYDEFEEDDEEEEAYPDAETEIQAEQPESQATSRYAYVDPEEMVGEQQDIEKFIEEMNAQLAEAIEKPINIKSFHSAENMYVDVDLLGEPEKPSPPQPAVEVDLLGEPENPSAPQEKKPRQPDIATTDEAFKQAFLENLDSTLAIQPTTTEPKPPAPKPVTKPVSKPQPADHIQSAVKRTGGISGPGKSEAIPLRLRDSLAVEVKPRRPLLLILGLLAILLFSATLFVQLAYFRSSQLLDRFPVLQPLVERVCTTLSCRYSGPRDVSQIKLVSRDIRLHPKVNNALLISATFINRAAFKQPYPDITVTLSDLSGAMVAQRRFTPAEYLGRLNSPFLLMPSGKPVQIALEVVDPGKDAVNFEFTFQ
ncbi:MAG: DUF3426 domain-containing protein [Gammaproteobacteria bacterium]